MSTITQSKTISLAWLAAWTGVSGIGIVIGTLLPLQAIWSLGENASSDLPPILIPIVGGSLLGLGIGLGVGIAQWLVLRLRGITGFRWLISSIVGCILGGIVAIAISNAFSQQGEIVWVNLVAFGLFGAILGAVQFLLSRDILSNPSWIVASAIGLAAAMALMLGFSEASSAFALLGGLVYGLVTAVALRWSAK